MIQLNYTTLIFLIIILPLLFSFKWMFKYYLFYKPLAASILIVGGSYIFWDMLVTYRGDWWFNPEFYSGPKLFGLPIEEILFFVVVPYACIFIYENLVYFVGEKEIKFNKWVYLAVFFIFFIIGMVYYRQEYTILAMFSVALFFLIAAFLYPSVLKSRLYWMYIVISFVPFMIFNYLLTSLVVVYYNSSAIWGVRITTIPLEDFFYNFSMLSFYLLVYLYFKKRWIR
jgi:lycopene cyclase domain-containing protein